MSDPNVNDAGDTAVITVYPTTSPQDAETQDLVEQLRNDVVPATLAGEDARRSSAARPPPSTTSPSASPSGCRCSCWS